MHACVDNRRHMRDVFAQRTLDDIANLLEHLRSSLEESHSSVPGVTEWLTRTRAASVDEVASAWHASVTTCMNRKHARYVRAISSITNDDAKVLHAIRYRDVDAITACRNPLDPVDLNTLVAALSASDAPILWRYLDEISDACLRWRRTPIPAVPTHEDINADIARRRAMGKSAPMGSVTQEPASVRGLSQGLDDLWIQLCQRRDMDVTPSEATREHLRTAVRGTEPLTTESLCAAIPELGDAPYTSDHIEILERARNLVTMDEAIPSDMMKGIESMANRLVGDINSGRADLASLDIESIGQQVIDNVSEADIGAFASNLDKIIPALQRAQRMPPSS